MDVLSFFFRFGIHLQLNLMRKAFKQLTTEACLKPLTLCRYFFKSPKPKRAETSISYLISSELKEQSYQPYYTACYFSSKTHFFQQFPPSASKEFFFQEKYLAEVITSPTDGHSVQINLNIFFFIIYLCTNTMHIHKQDIIYRRIMHLQFMFTNLNISYKRIKFISVFAN